MRRGTISRRTWLTSPPDRPDRLDFGDPVEKVWSANGFNGCRKKQVNIKLRKISIQVDRVRSFFFFFFRVSLQGKQLGPRPCCDSVQLGPGAVHWVATHCARRLRRFDFNYSNLLGKHFTLCYWNTILNFCIFLHVQTRFQTTAEVVTRRWIYLESCEKLEWTLDHLDPMLWQPDPLLVKPGYNPGIMDSRTGYESHFCRQTMQCEQPCIKSAVKATMRWMHRFRSMKLWGVFKFGAWSKSP